jgi:hypothetical protein
MRRPRLGFALAGLVLLALWAPAPARAQARMQPVGLKVTGAAAKALEAQKVEVILALGSSTGFTTLKATQSVPIVFHTGADPVALGLVENYRKPGGRLTGLSSQSRALAPKRLELLKDMVPTIRRVVTFYNPDNPTSDLGPVAEIIIETALAKWPDSSRHTSPARPLRRAHRLAPGTCPSSGSSGSTSRSI